MILILILILILWQKTNRNLVYRGLYSYRQRVRVITLFPNIFSYCFCMLSGEFAKVFERKVWRVQVAHLHNAERALSLSTSLAKISVVIVVKKVIECRLAWHWWNSTYLGLSDMFLCRNCLLYIIIQKIAPQAESGKYFQIWFSPDLGGKNGGVLSMRMQVILDSLYARPGSAPISGKESSGTGLGSPFNHWCTTTLKVTKTWKWKQMVF